MTRSPLGWTVPTAVWERFVREVEVKWGDRGPHIRFELETAMVEFLDQDDELVKAEKLLREVTELRGLSSSTLTLGRDVSPSEKEQIGYRIREVLQDRFKTFVAEEFNNGASGRYGVSINGHTTYGEALTAALNEYCEGGRSRRVRELAETVATGGDRSSESVENLGVNSPAASDQETRFSRTDSRSISIDPGVTIEIAKQLNGQFMREDIVEEISEHYSPDELERADDLIDRYVAAVVEQLEAKEHPHTNGLYLTPDACEELTFWNDMGRKDRVEWLQERLLDQADESNGRASVEYKNVMGMFREEFGDGPSIQYAYDLMEDAAELSGFTYTKPRGGGAKQLRVDADRAVEADSPEESGAGSDTSDAGTEPDTADETADWLKTAAEVVPDELGADAPNPVLRNKIGKARWPDEINDGGTLSERALSRVDAEDVERLREQLDSADAPTTTGDAVESTHIRADGGRPPNA